MNLRIAILTTTFVIVSSPRPSSRQARRTLHPDEYNKKHSGWYTKYEYVGNRDTDSPLPPGSQFQKIWMLMSTGSEYATDFEEMNEIKEEILSRNVPYSPIWNTFATWPDAVLQYGSVGLSDEGLKEIYDIGQRTSTRFPELYSATYEEIISASDGTPLSERCRLVFLRTAIGFGMADNFLQSYSNSSLVFRLIHVCRFMAYALRDAESELERRLYELYTSPRAVDALEKLQNYLHIHMTIQKAILIYQAYGYETGILESPETQAAQGGVVKRSVWMRALSIEIAEIIQESAELELYLRNGYYDKRNYEPVCLIFKEIVNFFYDDTKKYAFYVAPAEMIVKMLTYLGLYNATEGARYHAPSASNIAFVSFVHDGLSYVSLLFQERYTVMLECGRLCLLNNFRRLYANRPGCNPLQQCGDYFDL